MYKKYQNLNNFNNKYLYLLLPINKSLNQLKKGKSFSLLN